VGECDESTVQQFTTRKHFVRRTTKWFADRYTAQTMKHTPSVMICDDISVNETGGLHFLPPEKNMNGQNILIYSRRS